MKNPVCSGAVSSSSAISCMHLTVVQQTMNRGNLSLHLDFGIMGFGKQTGAGLSPKGTAGVGRILTMEDAEHVLRNILCADLQPTDFAAVALA